MKPKWNDPNRLQRPRIARAGRPRVAGGAAEAASWPAASAGSSQIDAANCTDLYYSPGSPLSPVNLNEAIQWQAARVAFLRRHGPNATGPRGLIQSKPLRKALRAMEMAGWEAV